MSATRWYIDERPVSAEEFDRFVKMCIALFGSSFESRATYDDGAGVRRAISPAIMLHRQRHRVTAEDARDERRDFMLPIVRAHAANIARELSDLLPPGTRLQFDDRPAPQDRSSSGS